MVSIRKIKAIQKRIEARRKALEISLTAIGIAAVLGAVIVFPKMQTSNISDDPVARFDAENKARSTIIQGLAGLGGAFFFVTAYYTWRNLRISEDKQVTERFFKAVEMLADKERKVVRLGGIYSLERIARNSPKDHWTVMEVLAAFLQNDVLGTVFRDLLTDDSEERTKTGNTSTYGSEVAVEASEPSISADAQAAISVIARRNVDNDPKDGGSLNLNKVNLRGVELLEGAELQGAFLIEANLAESTLIEANFYWAWLARANFSRSRLLDINFTKANLIEANFSKAELIDVNFEEANLEGANFVGAKLRDVRSVMRAEGWRLAQYDRETKAKLAKYDPEFAKDLGLPTEHK